MQEGKCKSDQLNNRFSDLLVSSLIIEDKSDDSDSLFKGLKSCKNVTFSRSRSYFDDDLQLFPITPARTTDKNPLLTSDEEDTSYQNSNNQSGLLNSNSRVCNVTRSPLKVFSPNAMITPKLTEKTAKRNTSSLLRFSGHSSNRSVLKNRQNITNDSSTDKENLNTSLSKVGSVSLNSSLTGVDLLLFKTTNKISVDRTPVNKRKQVSKTSTPFNKALTPSAVFQTPVSSNKPTTPQLSILKRYSIDKAVASAKREIREMINSVKLKRKSSKTEEKSYAVEGTIDSPVSSVVRNSLFRTPTASTSNTTSKKNEATPLTGNRPTNVLTGVKTLGKRNDNQRACLLVDEEKTLSNDNEYDDIPATQPVSAILLRHVVAYVEVRCGRDYLSEGTKAELESLGAKVEKNFTRKVTHCFFHNGKMSTYRKAIEWKIPLVSTLWIEACKAELRMLPIKGYAPSGLDKYKEALPLYRLKTKGLRRAVTDSKIRRKPWKEDEMNKATLGVKSKPLPPVPTFKETNNIVDALHAVAGDLRKATKQFEKILTSPVLQKKTNEEQNNSNTFENGQTSNTSNCRKKRNKKLVFGSSSDDENGKKESATVNETGDTSSKISDVNDSEVRVSYDSDDLLIYAKKQQAANLRSSAPSRLLTSRKCKKLLSSCKDQEKKKNGEINVGSNVDLRQQENVAKVNADRPTRKSKNQLNDGKVNEKEYSSVKPTQTKKRKLLLPSRVIEDFNQDSGESTPPGSPKNPYKPTPNKKPRTGLAVKSKTVLMLASVRVASDCDSDDSLTRAARRESSALFVKKDKKIVPQKITPTIVCTSLSRSDEAVVKSIVAQLGTFAVEAAVSERTTHVVTPSPRRTINLLKAIARGCWVLNVQWVYHSLEVGQWLPEERFELTDFSPAVKLARCDRQAFGPEFGLELFTGLGPFYVCRSTVPPSRDLAELLRLGGGVVVSNARAAKIVIGTTPPLSPCGRTPPTMVKEKWVLDCITRLSRLPTSDYIVITAEP
ncbi:uncharacterized protein LOC128994826 [Macrosteles quadrilineatus]|uniref:uncharacterized protein LOC128994826 n=1 Tax=Macrosteles quadrilineatus TaxID=74068 RepID=UPI0023E2EF29|nr:uncharacterized protein LOC128994826 [Macrosteles quadrilineatus]XP_054275601.1 uncharacterized protein LOC128994826 [Macrosteles quadrilineatus]